MANILINTACNRQCPYCFAGRDEGEANSLMTTKTFAGILDRIKGVDGHSVRLLGGEPTLHPKFPEFLKNIQDNDLKLMLFTNGIVNDTAIAAMEEFPLDKLSLLVNIHPRSEYSDDQWGWVERVLGTFQKSTMLGINLYKRNQDLDFVLDLIDENDIGRDVRLGIAHHRVGHTNEYLHPKFFVQAGRKIQAFELKARSRSIFIKFDCGFVPCMFDEDYLENYSKYVRKFKFLCDPMPDISTEGAFFHCFPLENQGTRFFPQDTGFDSIVSDLRKDFSGYKSIGIYKHCSTCPWKASGQCGGGCIASAMQRLQSEPKLPC